MINREQIKYPTQGLVTVAQEKPMLAILKELNNAVSETEQIAYRFKEIKNSIFGAEPEGDSGCDKPITSSYYDSLSDLLVRIQRNNALLNAVASKMDVF